ncbi:MAG: hypothetical protein JWQ03_3234 [Variovorax sp.]|nr:hypothetical protein [Variovorax sp.]
MSLWQLGAAVEGYNRKQGGGDSVKAPTPEEHDAMLEEYADIIAKGERGE